MPQLYPKQEFDARTLAMRRGGLLTYEPGLGKTPTAIRTAQLASPTGPWAIVAPRNALENWQEELATWAPGRSNVLLTHYEALAKNEVLQQAARARVVLFDEIHEARDVDTLAFKRCYQISRSNLSGLIPKKVYGLSATPIFNGVTDLLAQLVLVGVYDYAQYPALVWRYTLPQLGGIHAALDYRTATRVPELKAVLDATTIRRTYADMGVGLPPLVPSKHPVYPDPASVGADYLAARTDFSAWYQQTQGRQLPPLARFTTLRRLQSMAKAPTVVQRAELERRYGYNILIFTEFRDTAQWIHGKLAGSSLVIGGQTIAARAAQLGGTGAGQVLVATMDSLDSALNLQKFSRVFYVDLPWTPAALDQTFKRAWRNLQRQLVSLVYFYMPADDAEKHVSSVLLRKTDLLRNLGLEPTGSFRHLGF